MTDKYFYGVDDVIFNWHGITSDPTITYKGHNFNYYDVENALWDTYKDCCDSWDEAPNEEGFENWIDCNPSEVYGLLDDMIAFKDGCIA